MKKILLLILLLIPVSLYATDTYSADVVAVWEDSGVDIVNGYTMTNNNSGGTWANTPLTPAKENDYYYTSYSNNWNFIPADPQTALKNASKWTIQWYGWLPTKDAGSSANSPCWYFGRGTNGGTGGFAIWLLWNAWNPWGTSMSAWFGDTGQVYIGTFSATNYPDGSPGNRWATFQVVYDGSYYKFYMGTPGSGSTSLLWTSTSGKTNLFSNTTDNTAFRTSSQFGNDYSSYYAQGMDRIIFSTNDYAGVEITPLPPSSPTNTPSATDTPSPSPTGTFTITQTITPTYTPTHTPTYTITPTITPTYTITPTPQVHGVTSTTIIGYRIERVNHNPIVVYKAIDRTQFVEYDIMYNIFIMLGIFPDDINIIPLY